MVFVSLRPPRFVSTRRTEWSRAAGFGNGRWCCTARERRPTSTYRPATSTRNWPSSRRRTRSDSRRESSPSRPDWNNNNKTVFKPKTKGYQQLHSPPTPTGIKQNGPKGGLSQFSSCVLRVSSSSSFLRLFFLPLFFCYNTTIILDAFLSRTAGSPPESTNLHPLLLPFGSLRSSFVSFARKKHTLPHTHKRQKNYPSDESVMTFFPSAAVSVSRSTCPRRFIGFSIAVGSAQQTQKRRGTHLNHWS